MTAAEKKEFEKEKNRKKQEFFANRKASRNKGKSGGAKNNSCLLYTSPSPRD